MPVFEFVPKITKELILSKTNEESIMFHYLGTNPGKTLIRSPFRNDKSPTCSIYKNKKGILYFHDFATNEFLNCFGVVMKKYGCSYAEAVQMIAEDFGIIENKSDRKIKPIEYVPPLQEKPDTVIQIQEKSFSDTELKWWSSFGVTKETLKKFNVHSCDSIFLNGQYFGSSSSRSFMFGYYGGKKDGQELWRIYMPQKKSFRFLSNWNKSLLQGMKNLPLSGDLLVITKSLKDVMVLYELGISAIAPCSETLFLSKIQLSKLKAKFQNIVVWYDNDLPGIAGLKRIKKENPDLLYFFIPRKYEAKDISDFYKKYGKEKTKDFINDYKSRIYERH